MATSKKLPFEVLLNDDTQGGDTALATVVSSEAAWNALGLSAELPQVDFRSHVLLVAAAGRRPDTSYQLEITDVIDASEAIGAQVAFVLLEERDSGSGADMLSSPLVVAAVAKTGHHFVFARR